jgi:hypothetical protein
VEVRVSTHDLIVIADAVDELTRSHTNNEPYNRLDEHGTLIAGRHQTHVPPLLEQLQQALEPTTRGTEPMGTVPGSRPSARIDAMDVYMRIDQAAYIWCKTYVEQRRWDSLTDRLRALVGAAPNMEDDDQHSLARESRRWVTWAKVTTGWEVPARQPDNTCPLCATRGSLRVRVGNGVTSNEASACCVACGEAWDDSNIGLLAEHIRAENGDEPLWVSA